MDLPTLTKLLSSLSHETRAKVFFTVLESPEPLHSAAVGGIIGIREALASHHLGILLETNLVVRTMSGKYALFVANKRTVLELAYFFYNLVDTKQAEPEKDYS